MATCTCGHETYFHKPTAPHPCISCDCLKYVWDGERATEMSKRKKKGKQKKMGFDNSNVGTVTTVYSKHYHEPRLVLAGANGWEIWAGTGHDCKSALYDGQFDLAINCAKIGLYPPKHKIPFAWGEEFLSGHFTEIELDWDNGAAPQLPPKFWLRLLEQIRKDRSKALVFCIGGHGRTGTALAALQIARGATAERAIADIRASYCHEAVESHSQVDYLRSVEKYFAKKLEVAKQ